MTQRGGREEKVKEGRNGERGIGKVSRVKARHGCMRIVWGKRGD